MQASRINNSPQSAHHKNKQALELQQTLSGLTPQKKKKEGRTERGGNKALIQNNKEYIVTLSFRSDPVKVSLNAEKLILHNIISFSSSFYPK